jgi:ABC transporter substrate binding protein (PQQ-dependent alcohol dehydrogenase system)
MASSSTTRALRTLASAAIAVLGLFLHASASRGQTPAREIRIVYVEREDDPRYETVRITDGVYRVQLYPPFAGAELGIADVRPLGEAVGARFSLERRTVPPDADIAEEVGRIVDGGAAAILVDLPAGDIVAAAKARPPGRTALFNIREEDDALRRDLCAADLFHVVPSRSGLTDALAQFVVRRNWRRVLALVGPEPGDDELLRSFQASARKFGARIVDVKPFVAGNDPRQREQTNVALMTGEGDFDVVFLADTTGDFGRFVGYRLARPRPVIGTEGLSASAWHASSERYGAPQVNTRFERRAHRQMTATDWSAWVAVRAVAEAVARTPAATGPEIARALVSGGVSVEMSKGVPGSFRSWDKQLRQPIMLHTHNAVIEVAPLEGFLHERSTLDTLGLAENQVPCR